MYKLIVIAATLGVAVAAPKSKPSYGAYSGYEGGAFVGSTVAPAYDSQSVFAAAPVAAPVVASSPFVSPAPVVSSASFAAPTPVVASSPVVSAPVATPVVAPAPVLSAVPSYSSGYVANVAPYSYGYGSVPYSGYGGIVSPYSYGSGYTAAVEPYGYAPSGYYGHY